ncbi:MAG: NAD(P)-binding domain-containing protein [Burkholderiales bacterium]
MKFGIVGLGRMGRNLSLQAIGKKHRVVAYDAAADWELTKRGFDLALTLKDLVNQLEAPRIVLMYVPHGKPTDDSVNELSHLLDAGDIVADGGNSHWKDSVRHYQELKQKGIAFLDVGTSGGIEGAQTGACFMVGGDQDAYKALAPLLNDLAVPGGVIHAGASGAGHFVKLIHNAIEFGMVQAIGEGVDLLVRSDYPLDLPALFRNWNHGSVIRVGSSSSWSEVCANTASNNFPVAWKTLARSGGRWNTRWKKKSGHPSSRSRRWRFTATETRTASPVRQWL